MLILPWIKSIGIAAKQCMRGRCSALLLPSLCDTSCRLRQKDSEYVCSCLVPRILTVTFAYVPLLTCLSILLGSGLEHWHGCQAMHAGEGLSFGVNIWRALHILVPSISTCCIPGGEFVRRLLEVCH